MADDWRLPSSPHSDPVGLRERMLEIASQWPRFGHLRIHIPLKREGLVFNHKRTYRHYCA